MAFLNKKIKKGFTLSELMVTLGVIGVLGAIIIPAVRQNVPSQNRVMFKKAYMITEKAISEMINDVSIYPDTQTTTIDGTVYYNGFAYTTDPTGNAVSKDKFCYYFTEKLNTVGSATCPTDISDGTVHQVATTTDGMVWYMASAYGAQNFAVASPDDAAGYNYYIVIIIDVNGTNKGPNCLSDTKANEANRHVLPLGTTQCTAEKNPDLYTINVAYDGALRIANICTMKSSVEISNPVEQEIMLNQTKNTSN